MEPAQANAPPIGSADETCQAMNGCQGCGNKTGNISAEFFESPCRIFVHRNHTNWNGQADAYTFGNSPVVILRAMRTLSFLL